MSVLSTGSPDPDDPRATPEEPVSPGAARQAGSPPPASAAPHEGLVGEPDQPLGDDPRPGNVGHSGEATRTHRHEDVLDEAADDTFPASDPPSRSTGPTVGEERPEPAGTPATGQKHGLGRVVEEG
jgi:hypothetical protein